MSDLQSGRSDEKLKILLVDDEPLNVRLLKNLLASLNHQLLVATDGVAALKMVEQHVPDLILLDVMMPGIDGFEVCERLKSDPLYRNIPIIIITGLSATNDYVRALDLGVDDFIAEPIDAVIIKARVKGYLKAKALWNKVEHLNQLQQDLTRMIVHDLRAPMSEVIGYLDMLLNYGSLEDSDRQLLNSAMLAAQDATDLINNILGMEKLESGTLKIDLENVNISHLVTYILNVLNGKIINRELTVETTGPDDLHWNCDKNLIVRVIQNLLDNTIKFAPRDSAIEIKSDGDGHGLLFKIANHGEPISPDLQRVIFNKFVQVEGDKTGSHNKGYGLGLAFARMAIDAHKGIIDISSPVPGWKDGVCIYFSIPLNADEEEQDSSQNETAKMQL